MQPSLDSATFTSIPDVETVHPRRLVFHFWRSCATWKLGLTTKLLRRPKLDCVTLLDEPLHFCLWREWTTKVHFCNLPLLRKALSQSRMTQSITWHILATTSFPDPRIQILVRLDTNIILQGSIFCNKRPLFSNQYDSSVILNRKESSWEDNEGSRSLCNVKA